MERTILKDITKQAKEQADEYQLYHNHLVLAYRRNRRRISNPPLKDVKTPHEWSIDKKFNPFYVLKRDKQRKQIFICQTFLLCYIKKREALFGDRNIYPICSV